jgi:hypothetical protein
VTGEQLRIFGVVSLFVWTNDMMVRAAYVVISIAIIKGIMLAEMFNKWFRATGSIKCC